MDQITFKQQLNTISAVRLPMILAILSCHVVAPCIHGTPDWYFIKLIGHEIASIGVPLFFFISGLLFFVNVDKHSSIIDFVLQIGGG